MCATNDNSWDACGETWLFVTHGQRIETKKREMFGQNSVS